MKQLLRDWWPILVVVALALGGLWVYSVLHTPDVMDLYSAAWHQTKGGEAEADFYRARLGRKYGGSGKVIAYKRVGPNLVVFNVEGKSHIRGNAFIECAGPPEPFKVGDSISFTATVSEFDNGGVPTVLPKVTDWSKD